ncbi:MAG TPA: hemolysin family protein [Chitinispirillaceae bacterium]|nr:hemolysin family protein [Chitinispirillaceae bacterium]
MESGPSASFLFSGLVIAYLLSSLFSVIKIIFNSFDKALIPADDEHLRYYASKVEELMKNQPLLNSTVSFGKTLANITFSVFAYLLWQRIIPYFPLYQTIVISLGFSLIILTLFAYEIPRAFSLRFYRTYFPVAYTGYKMFGWLVLPFSSLFLAINKWILKVLKYDEKYAFLTEEEKARMNHRNDTEALDEEEKEMIRSIFDLGETTVDEIMVPRIDIKALDINSDINTVLKIVREEGHSRVPVYNETIDSITGILYAKDILSWLSENEHGKWNLKNLLKKPHYVPVGKKVNDLMKEFKMKHIHLAIVVDEYGGTAGLVTMEDILEEIVGDIQDEYDEEEKEVIKIADNTYLIDPHIDLHDLNEELNINLETEEVDYNTLGGLIYHEYGDIPQENTEFDHDGLHITVLKMNNQRIEKVKVEILQHPANSIQV